MKPTHRWHNLIWLIIGAASTACTGPDSALPPQKGDSTPSHSDSPTTDDSGQDSDSGEPPDSSPDSHSDTDREDSPPDSEDSQPDSEGTDSDSAADSAVMPTLDLELTFAKLIGEDSGDTRYDAPHIALRGNTDFNADGVSDVLMGMSTNGRGGIWAGTGYLLHGPFSGTRDLSTAEAMFVGTVPSYGENCGYDLASAGDVNADGLEDVLIGCIGYDPGAGYAEGQVYLFWGPFSGSDSTTNADVTLHGEETGVNWVTMTKTGYSVDSAGDVNGDGYADILVGAPGGQEGNGLAYLLPGPVESYVELSSEVWRLEGSYGGASVGADVKGVGDLDGDGLDDVLIGGQDGGGSAGFLFTSLDTETPPQRSDASATFVSDPECYSASDGGDLNDDGHLDLVLADCFTMSDGLPGGVVAIVLGPFQGTIDLDIANVRIYDSDSQSGFFAGEVVGDLNGDGTGDVVAGAPGAYTFQAGAALVFFGPFAGSLTAEDANFRLVGDGQDGAGWCTSAAGDVDADGLDDFWVGGPGDEDGGGPFAGAAWLVLGSSLR